MKNTATILLALLGWFSVVTQLYLMMENRVTPVGETIVRFFSYFTILTNTLVALYFTSSWMGIKQGGSKLFKNPGAFTSITTYITVVGLTYQILLRHTWQPTGLQLVVDELLHTIIPVLVIIFWYVYANKSKLMYKQIINWLIYPLIYLVFVLARGALSDFYPYPFIDVGNLGWVKVFANSFVLIIFFMALSATFVWIGGALNRK